MRDLGLQSLVFSRRSARARSADAAQLRCADVPRRGGDCALGVVRHLARWSQQVAERALEPVSRRLTGAFRISSAPTWVTADEILSTHSSSLGPLFCSVGRGLYS